MSFFGGDSSVAELFITGDKHGGRGMKYLSSAHFPAGNLLTGEDFVVILGDFGLLWNNPPSEAELNTLRWLSAKNWTTLVVDGNHENFDLMDALPAEVRWGAPVGVIAPNIYHLRRGYIYTIAGKSVFVFGGAESPDRGLRNSGKNWWPREILSLEEAARGFDSLDRAGWKVDYVWTHAAPSQVLHHLFGNPRAHAQRGEKKVRDPVSWYLNEIAGKLEFSMWCFGHYHVQSQPFSAGAKGLFRAEYREVRPLLVSEEMEKAFAGYGSQGQDSEPSKLSED